DGVVLALPAHAAARIVAGLDAALSEALGAIPYGSAATVNLAYRREAIPARLEGFGIVVPRAEGRPLLACTFSSVKFPGRAPEGTVLLRVFLGGAAAEEGDAAILEREAREQLLDILGVEADPLLARSFVHPRAMPHYEVGHLDGG